MKVLLIEGDGSAAQSLWLMLRSEGFNVETADLGEEGCDLAKLYDYQAILLELTLPDMTGLDVLRSLRAAKVATPIIVMTTNATVDMKVRAFTAGADDYLAKPFHRDELVARLIALIRRSAGQPSPMLEIGPITLDLTNKALLVDGERIHLTGRQYGLAEALALRQGHVISKEALMTQLYGGMDEPEIKIIDVFVCKLRAALRELGADAHLETVWGQGYRFVAEPALKPEKRVQRERTIVQITPALHGALAAGDSTFRQLTARLSGWSSGSIRGALKRAVDSGQVANIGDQKSALYHLKRDRVAA